MRRCRVSRWAYGCGVPRERNIGGLQWEVNARGWYFRPWPSGVEVMNGKEGSGEQFSCPEIFPWMEVRKVKPQPQSWTRVEMCEQSARACVFSVKGSKQQALWRSEGKAQTSGVGAETVQPVRCLPYKGETPRLLRTHVKKPRVATRVCNPSVSSRPRLIAEAYWQAA